MNGQSDWFGTFQPHYNFDALTRAANWNVSNITDTPSQGASAQLPHEHVHFSTACGECNNLGEMGAESGVLCRRFLHPSHPR